MYFLMRYPVFHIIGISIAIFGLVFSGILIKKYSKEFDHAVLFWILWWLALSLIVGYNFI